MKKKFSLGKILVILALSVYAVFLFFPIITILITSFTPTEELAGSVEFIWWPENFTLDAYTALFISKAITQTTATKYSYGHMASLDRIKKDKIYLPVNANGEVDFQFVSSFMRQIEQRILKPTIDKLCKKMVANELLGG